MKCPQGLNIPRNINAQEVSEFQEVVHHKEMGILAFPVILHEFQGGSRTTCMNMHIKVVIFDSISVPTHVTKRNNSFEGKTRNQQ